MELEIFTTASQLGGTVFTVTIFLWYLSRRDREWMNSHKASSDSNIVLAKALQRLTDTVMRNTEKIKENVPEVAKNTDAIKENTDTIKETKSI